MAIAFADVIEQRIQEEWPADILDMLIQIALHHNNPLSGELPIRSSDEDSNQSCHYLNLGAINCARGRAFYTISQLLWNKNEWCEVFREVTLKGADDPNPAVLPSVMQCAVAWYNLDKAFSIQIFQKLVERDLRMLAAHDAFQIVQRCYLDMPAYYREKLSTATESGINDLRKCAIEIMATLVTIDYWMFEQLVTMQLDDLEINIVCRKAAAIFCTVEYHELGKKIIMSFMDKSEKAASATMSLLEGRNLSIDADRDIIIQLLHLKENHWIAQHTIDYLNKTDGDITGYADDLLELIQSTSLCGHPFYDIESIVLCVIRISQQASNDPSLQEKSLLIWDQLFRYKPTAIKSLSDLMDGENA